MIFKSLIIAFSMYSKIPMPHIEWDEKSMKYAFCFFPLIGIIIGAVTVMLGEILMNTDVGSLFFGCIMTAVPVFVTGGIHLDGFLDTMDGICSYGDKEKRLEILKDSNSGAFAIIGGLIYFTLSVGFWSEIDRDMLFVIAVGFCISRALSAFSVVSFPMAKNTGLAVMFGNSAHKAAVRVIMVAYVIICGVLLFAYEWKSALMTLFISVLCFGYHYYNCKKNFGGITGDLAGFFLQMCELCILGGCAVWEVIL